MARAKPKRRAPAAAPPAPAEAPPPAVELAPEPPPPASDLLIALGALLLIGLAAVVPAGPARSPRAFAVAGWLAAAGGLCTLLALALGPRSRALVAPLATSAGVLALLAAFGVAPELVPLPSGGLGERIFGLPTAVGLPLGGALLLFGRSTRTATAGAALAVLALVGLLHPHADVKTAWPALRHLVSPLEGRAAWGALAMAGAAGLGIAGGALPSLRKLAGLVMLGVPVGWQLLELEAARGAGGTMRPAIAALVLLAGSALCLGGSVDATAHRLPRWTRTSWETAAVLGLIGVWLLLKSFTWRWSTTDENIYYYAAVATARGELPYRDFFFAHPPMHAAIPALIFGLLGFDIRVAKLVPVAATLLGALLLWRLVRERLGPVVALFTLGSLLFAFEVLQGSTNMNGVGLTNLALVAALFLLYRGRPAAAGAALGLAVTTGFYAMGGALGLVVLGFFKSRRDGLRQLAAFAAVAGALNAFCWLLAGDAYTLGVYRFHGLKAEKAKLIAYLKTFYHHVPLAYGLWLAPAVAAWLEWRRAPLLGVGRPVDSGPHRFFDPRSVFSSPETGLVKAAWLLAVAFLLELRLVNEVYDFYFVLAFPYAALCLGFVLAGIASAVVHECRRLTLGQRDAVGPAVVIALIAAFLTWLPMGYELNWVFSQDATVTVTRGGRQVRQPDPTRPAKGNNPDWVAAGTPRSYPWVDPPVWASVAGPIVRALFWRDHRLRGQVEPGYRHFLWQKVLHLSTAQEIGDWVRAHSSEGETVAGNSLTAPGVALASGRRLAGGFVDTNAKRFKTKITSFQEMFEAICKDRIRYLVTGTNGYFQDHTLARIPTAFRYFRPVRVYPDPANKFGAFAITLWELRDMPTDAGAPRCRWLDRMEPPPATGAELHGVRIGGSAVLPNLRIQNTTRQTLVAAEVQLTYLDAADRPIARHLWRGGLGRGLVPDGSQVVTVTRDVDNRPTGLPDAARRVEAEIVRVRPLGKGWTAPGQ